MKELISMTNFVLKQQKELKKWGLGESLRCIERVIKYAEFLQQPLTLGMFIPCVNNEAFNYSIHGNEEEFLKAKEKVLFENLSCKFGMIGIEKEKGWSSLFDLDFRPNNTVEDLLGEKFKYQLTESALKQIGLWDHK